MTFTPSTAESTLSGMMSDPDFEQVILCRDPGAGLRSVIAVHNTTLGPSLGGIRMRPYATDDDALADALDLAEAMTYKAALAGLDLGGGKSVINADPATLSPPARSRVIAAHARYIGALGGRYIPSVDMGTTVEDLDIIAGHVAVVASRHRDPSWFTAAGVVRSIEAALHWSGEDEIRGTRVAVQGLGHVGRWVVALLTAQGAELLVADVDDARVGEVQRQTAATPVPVDEVLLADVDVVCPCGPGGVVTEAIAERLKARVLIGAANNLFFREDLATTVVERGIVHVPDFVANAGGLLAAAADIDGDDDGLAMGVEGIARTSVEILDASTASGRDPVTVAKEIARQRLALRRASRPYFATVG